MLHSLRLDLSQPQVMGILNITPDSFSDGGRFNRVDQAVERALQMEKEGAAIIDIGGESTRPGAEPVSAEQEMERVIPIIAALQSELSIPISIDTHKPEVMRAAVAAGARLINDVNALRTAGALEAAAELQVPVCIMHMQGEPRTMQQNPAYQDVVAEVSQFLLERAQQAQQAGIKKIILDPGFGFGKTLAHNLTLLRRLDELVALGYPVLVGLSRKSMLGQITGRPVTERLAASIAAALIAAQKGAQIIRVHDVAATVDALKVLQAL